MKRMNDEQKGKLIASIMSELKSHCTLTGKHFDEGIFFDLIFKSDKELKTIAAHCGIR